MPKKKEGQHPERGVSLAPLSFGEALDALLRVKPDDDRPKRRGGKKPPKKDQMQQPDD